MKFPDSGQATPKNTPTKHKTTHRFSAEKNNTTSLPKETPISKIPDENKEECEESEESVEQKEEVEERTKKVKVVTPKKIEKKKPIEIDGNDEIDIKQAALVITKLFATGEISLEDMQEILKNLGVCTFLLKM